MVGQTGRRVTTGLLKNKSNFLKSDLFPGEGEGALSFASLSDGWGRLSFSCHYMICKV